MIPGYREERGLLWPADDVECAKAVFNTLDDCDAAVKHCRHRRLVVQAGGNMGVWALHLAKVFQRVITFEPDPVNFIALDANTAGVGNIEKYQAALSDKPGFCGLERIAGNAGAHQVFAGGKEAPFWLLDDMALPALDFLCLDIEGHEYHALRGARDTIARCKPVILIEDKGLSRRYGIEQGACEAMLKTYGYSVAARRRRDIILVAQ